MLAEQRAEQILRELAQRRAATVTDLCQILVGIAVAQAHVALRAEVHAGDQAQ